MRAGALMRRLVLCMEDRMAAMLLERFEVGGASAEGVGSCISRGAEVGPQRITRAIRDACKRKLQMFAAWPDWGLEDLVQHCEIAVAKSWRAFRPAKAQWSTWLNLVCARKLIELSRSLARRSRRDALGGVVDYYEPIDAGELEPFEGPPDPRNADLVAWLRRVYETARAGHQPAALRQGRRIYRAAQVLAMGALMRRLNLSSRGAVELLRARGDLCRIVGMEQAPSHRWLNRAREVVTEKIELIKPRRRREKTTA